MCTFGAVAAVAAVETNQDQDKWVLADISFQPHQLLYLLMPIRSCE
jgi:hypothetical protein